MFLRILCDLEKKPNFQTRVFTRFVDFVSINEGVYTLHDLLKTNKKDHLDKVRGLGYKMNDDYVERKKVAYSLY